MRVRISKNINPIDPESRFLDVQAWGLHEQPLSNQKPPRWDSSCVAVRAGGVEESRKKCSDSSHYGLKTAG